MGASPDVVVIGGGIVGSACARSLALGGASVTLLQRPDTPGEGWRAAAGMLAAQVEAGPDDPLVDLSVAGRAFYRRAAPALLETTGVDVGLVECGILQVAQSEAEVVAAKAKVAWQRQQAHRADWLSPEEVAEGWPWLAPGLGAFWSPDDGVVDPLRTVEAFRRDAELGGAKIVHDTAIRLLLDDGALRGVVGEHATYSAGHVVIAAGAWAGRIGGLPRPLSVEPVRGQMAAFPWPEGAAASVVYGPHCYLLRRGEEMLIGATMEHVGFDATVSEAGISGLLRGIASIYPAIAGKAPLRTWAGLRPGTPDGLPIIGAEPRLSGLWYAAGHGRNGVLLAGVTGELIAQELLGESGSTELVSMRPTRFWDW